MIVIDAIVPTLILRPKGLIYTRKMHQAIAYTTFKPLYNLTTYRFRILLPHGYQFNPTPWET